MQPLGRHALCRHPLFARGCFSATIAAPATRRPPAPKPFSCCATPPPQLRYKAPNFEAHGTGRDAFIVQANLAVGTQGLMHIVDNVVTYYPEKKKP